MEDSSRKEEELQSIFGEFDTDGDGELSLAEATTMLQHVRNDEAAAAGGRGVRPALSAATHSFSKQHPARHSSTSSKALDVHCASTCPLTSCTHASLPVC